MSHSFRHDSRISVSKRGTTRTCTLARIPLGDGGWQRQQQRFRYRRHRSRRLSHDRERRARRIRMEVPVMLSVHTAVEVRDRDVAGIQVNISPDGARQW